MCHGCFSLLLVATGDAGDLDFGVVLPVAHLLAMVLAAAELDDADLVGATLADDFRGHAGALERVADLAAVAIAAHETVVARDLVAGLVLREQPAAERLPLHHAGLLNAVAQNSVPEIGRTNISPQLTHA